MYCPKCGHEPGSDQHFCRNCGMQLDRAALLESNSGGIMPASQTFGNAPLTPRQRGVRMGVLLFGIGLGLIPLMFLLSLIVDKAMYLLAPAIIFLLAGLIRTGYAMLLEEGEEVFRKGLKRSDSTAWNASLPPRPVGMRHLISQNKNTDEMVAPPSATENTTQLLNKPRPESR